MVLTVGVLGPLVVAVDGRPVRLTSSRLRTLLVVLAMAAGSPLPVERLAAALWDGEPPANVRRVVQTYLGRLRDTLGGGLIATELAGYRLRIDPEHVDALRFTRLLDAAAQAPDSAGERTRLDEALALWRGEPFDDVPSHWLARSEQPRLVERYLAATERRIDLGGANGRAGDVVAQLHELTARFPLRESLWTRLLVALDRSGRQAEALASYEQIRRRLAEELGTGPGPELRRIHADLLAGRRSKPEPAPAAEAAVIPRQLPADIDGFTGRGYALKALDTLVGHRDQLGPSAVLISAIAGTAGVGKTALAVHWAHQVAHRYPDGQLYVNLRGFAPAGQAMTPAEAIRGFLAALDVPVHQMPSDLDAQIGLYRSLLAGKQILIVLDNARDPDQVRPLLPGSPTCLVLVTSRNQLTSLIAAEAAKPLVLDLLPVDEARELLIRRLGSDRVAAEPAAVEDIITRCVRLPLALAIAAAHAAIRPEFPLATIATQLRDEGTRLDTLASDDPTADVRAVFSWSYQALSADAARLFRLIGLHPGPDIAPPAAASLTGLPPAQTRPLLAELRRAHLLAEHTPGRYTLHDLLRTYTAELTHEHDDVAERHAALHRLLDHYLHTGHTAATVLNPHREPIAIAPSQPGVAGGDPVTFEQAQAWLDAEQAVLLAAVAQAPAGFDTHTWQLAWTISDFLYRRGQWTDVVATQRAAVAAAQRAGHGAGQARAHRYLAMGLARLGDYEDALRQLRHALDLYDREGEVTGQAHTYIGIARINDQCGQHTEALHHCEQALDLFAQAGNEPGQAEALNAIGWCHARLGNFDQTIGYVQQALTRFELPAEMANNLLPDAWDSLGYAHQNLGRYSAAISCYRHAIDLYRRAGARRCEADSLARLGDAHLSAGEPEAARTAWRQALGIFDESARHQADQVRTKLQAVGG